MGSEKKKPGCQPVEALSAAVTANLRQVSLSTNMEQTLAHFHPAANVSFLSLFSSSFSLFHPSIPACSSFSIFFFRFDKNRCCLRYLCYTNQINGRHSFEKKNVNCSTATGQNAAHLGPPAAFPHFFFIFKYFLKNNEIQMISLLFFQKWVFNTQALKLFLVCFCLFWGFFLMKQCSLYLTFEYCSVFIMTPLETGLGLTFSSSKKEERNPLGHMLCDCFCLPLVVSKCEVCIFSDMP